MEEYLEFSKLLALESAKIMLQYFTVGVNRELKNNNTPVTIADTSINSLVIKTIKEKYPTHSIIGEEESFIVDNAPYSWVCDPIDGTIPYTFGTPTNVFSIALVERLSGLPIVAVVYDPYMKRMYTAIKGIGAFLNDNKINVNSISKLKDAVIGGSGTFSDVVNGKELKGEIIKVCWRPVVINSAIYEAMLVASGQIAASVYPGSNSHDAVTSKLIVEEAGGKVTDLFGKEQRYDKSIKGVIISNGLIHDDLIELSLKHKK